MALDFARDDTLVAATDHASCELGGEAVLLDLTTGVYYGLDPVGTHVWRLLQQPRSLRELCDLVIEEFDVDAQRCETDLMAFLGSLREHGLLRSGSAIPE